MAYFDKVSLGGTLYDVTDTKGRAMIAPKEETSTASAAHAKGTYFTFNDLLYRATADIAVGGTITPNTNCVAVTVGTETSELKSAFRSRFNGKKISIIGDSIETYNQAEYKIDGYSMYYPNHGVDNVNKTWWKQVIDNSGAMLEINASFSGSRVTDTASDTTYPDFYDRVSLLGSPDVIFVALGTNDSIGNVALGDYDFTTAYADLSESTFRTAYIKGIKALKAAYANADIICVTAKMGDAYKDSIRIIASTLSCIFIDASNYIIASGAHPGVKGMLQIASQVLFPVDKTLTQANIPADAEKTGKIKAGLDVVNGSVYVDSLSELILFGNYWIDNSEHLQIGSAWRAYQYKVDEYTALYLELYGAGDSQKAIGFYSDTPSDANYLDGIRFDAGTIVSTNYRKFETIDVPSGCKYVLITNRDALGLPIIKGIKAGKISSLDMRTSAAEADIDAIEADVNDIQARFYRTVSMSDKYAEYNGYFLNTGNKTGNANWRSYFFYADNIQIIDSVTAYTDSSVIPSILFYSDNYPNTTSETLISIVTPVTNATHTYTDVSVPANCKTIVVANKIGSYATPSVAFTEYKYDEDIDNLNDNVYLLFDEASIHHEVSHIYPGIWNTNDFCIIGDEVWCAKGWDGVTNGAEIRKYKMAKDGTVNFSAEIGKIYTDFGHINCIDYCPESDCLIFGNGANDTSTTGNWFGVVPNPKALTGTTASPSLLANVGIKYNVDIGYKVQAVWGDSNLGQYNIAIVFANDATTIKRYLLKKDSNGDFNGEMVEVESATIGTAIGVGGADYWNGILYIGNSDFGYYEVNMSDYSVKRVKKHYYNGSGTELTGSMQGIAIDDKYFWTFFNIAGAEAPNYLIQNYR